MACFFLDWAFSSVANLPTAAVALSIFNVSREFMMRLRPKQICNTTDSEKQCSFFEGDETNPILMEKLC